MDEITGRKGDNIRQAVPFVRQITQDGKPKLEVYRPTTNPIYYYTQVSIFINEIHVHKAKMHHSYIDYRLGGDVFK